MLRERGVVPAWTSANRPLSMMIGQNIPGLADLLRGEPVQIDRLGPDRHGLEAYNAEPPAGQIRPEIPAQLQPQWFVASPPPAPASRCRAL